MLLGAGPTSGRPVFPTTAIATAIPDGTTVGHRGGVKAAATVSADAGVSTAVGDGTLRRRRTA